MAATQQLFFACAVPGVSLKVEDVFSATAFFGNGGAQSIVTGQNIVTKGGAVTVRNRTSTNAPFMVDTVRGMTFASSPSLYPTSNSVADANTNLFRADATGFSFGTAASSGAINASGSDYIAWTFCNADKFHGIQTVVKSTGSNATVNFSNLGTLGMVRVKRTDFTGSWYVWHRSLSAGNLLIGQATSGQAVSGEITVSGTTVTLVESVISNGTYLVEAFAHDPSAGGIIQCGTFTSDAGGNATLTVGYEPQYLQYKRIDQNGYNWETYDHTRGMNSVTTARISADAAAVETCANMFNPSSTGGTFPASLQGNATYVYTAIAKSKTALSPAAPSNWTLSWQSLYGSVSTPTKNGMMDGQNLNGGSYYGSNSQAGDFLMADFGSAVSVTNAHVMYVQGAASGGWGPGYTNGLKLQWLDANGTTWHDIATMANFTEGVNVAKIYPVNAVTQKIRLIGPGNSGNYVACGDFWFD